MVAFTRLTLLALFSVVVLSIHAQKNLYEVKSERLNVRSGPGTQYTIIDQLLYRDQIQVVGTYNAWVLVEYSGNLGYVYSNYIRKQLNEFSSTTKTNANESISNHSHSPESTARIRNEVKVLICLGPYAKKYHRSESCRGLNNCKSDITSVTLLKAEHQGKTPCLICY